MEENMFNAIKIVTACMLAPSVLGDNKNVCELRTLLLLQLATFLCFCTMWAEDLASLCVSCSC